MNNADLALVGAGYWGKNLARNFAALGALHTICDANQETLDSYGDSYPEARRETSFDAVLADSAITKVAIAAPAALHFPLARDAIAAGKDVYVEKPLCLTLADAERLIEQAEQADRVLMVGHLLQYHAYIQKLAEMIRDGELGRLYYITSNRLNLGKIRQEENSLWSFAPHDISVILRFAGQLPDSVACSGDSYLTHGVADTTLTQLKFSSGLRAHIYVSWLNPFKEQKLTVVGSEGMVVFDDTLPWDEKLVVYRDYLTWSERNLPTVNKNDGQPIVVEQSEPLKSECQHFLDCCADRSRPRTDGAEGLRVLQVLHAAQASLEREGSAQTLGGAGVQATDFHAHASAFIDPDAVIGGGTRIWHFSHISDGSRIGRSCNFGQNVFVAPQVTIGDNVKIQNNVSVYTGTTIEDDVFLGPSCVLTNVSNPRSEIVRRGIYEKTLIRRGATVGANATIVCGVTLGRYAFIAAGAVVTKDVPDYAMIRGVPAKQVGWMSRHGLPLEFDSSGTATCPESGFKYKLNKDEQSVTCLDQDEDEGLPEDQRVGTKTYRELK